MNKINTAILLGVLWVTLIADVCAAELVVVVTDKSLVSEIDIKTARKIFLGKTVALPNGPIAVPIYFNRSSPAYAEFTEYLLQKSPGQLRAYWAKRVFSGRGRRPAIVSSVEELNQSLSANLSAFGFLDRKDVDDSLRIVLVVNPVDQ